MSLRCEKKKGHQQVNNWEETKVRKEQMKKLKNSPVIGISGLVWANWKIFEWKMCL